MNHHVKENSIVLADCSAFHYKEKQHSCLATSIVPRSVKLPDQRLASCTQDACNCKCHGRNLKENKDPTDSPRLKLLITVASIHYTIFHVAILIQGCASTGIEILIQSYVSTYT